VKVGLVSEHSDTKPTFTISLLPLQRIIKINYKNTTGNKNDNIFFI